jgi:[ribosomal protein S5]-alanine N-acetyltransferase
MVRGMRVPDLPTSRLLVRRFAMDDLERIHHILDVELCNAELGTEGVHTLQSRHEWLDWTIRNYEQLARLNQPPYGDRAIVLAGTTELIGACGFVPCLAPFAQLPSWAAAATARRLSTTEIGLFYAISPRHQRHGYATEAARAMIRVAFDDLHLRRVVATTTYDNAASAGVMRALGMRIEKNPDPDPFWFQVVGVLENATTA